MIRLIRVSLCTGMLLSAGTTLARGESPLGVNPPEQHHQSIGKRIADTLNAKGLPKEGVIVLISTLPIVELRGAVPVGHILWDVPSMPSVGQKAAASVVIYALSVAGNMVPVPLIIWLLGPMAEWLRRFVWGRRLIDWLFARTRRKSASIEKYETLGLAIFVAIPLPVTGAWTGAMAAFLMGVKFRHAMWSILLGVMIAGVIMTTLSLLGWIGAAIAGIVLLGLAVSGLWNMLRKEEAGAEH